MSRTLHLVEQLIACRSVTPEDGGCQQIIRERLLPLGFEFETLVSGPVDFRVTNLWAVRRGSDAQAPLLAFAGHTDVVPTGPLEQWRSDPFVPTHREGRLYGRGAADMKSSLAAMVVATEEFVAAHPAHRGSLAFLLTSDEEGPANDGTVKVVEWLQRQGTRLDACIVGEPTSVDRLGDMVKNGRRGSLSGKLTVKGVQGHIAYPHLADNPTHRLARMIVALTATPLDAGTAHFEPSTLQVSTIDVGNPATNVIPAEARASFNSRFNDGFTPETLEAEVRRRLDAVGGSYELRSECSGVSFVTPPGPLSGLVTAAVQAVTGLTPELSTTGGTSDARFIKDYCPVIEFGLMGATMHKVDEHVAIADILQLSDIYERTLDSYFHAQLD